MGDDTSIRARLGLDVTDWRQNAKTAGDDVTKFTAKATEGKAAIAAFEQSIRAAGKATAEQKKMLADARSELARYEQQLRQAEKAVKSFAAATPAAAPKATSSRLTAPPEIKSGGGSGGDGNGLSARARSQELAHSGRAVADSLLSGQSPAHAVAQELPRVAESLNLGMGGTLGALGGGLLVSAMIQAQEEAKKLQKALIDAMAPLGGGDVRFQSIEALETHVRTTQAALKDLVAVEGTAGHALGILGQDLVTIWEKHGKVGPQDEAGNREIAEINAATDSMKRDVQAEAAKVGSRTQLAKEKFSYGPDFVAEKEIQQHADERTGDIRRSGLPGASDLIKSENAGAEEAKAEAELQARLHGIEREGRRNQVEREDPRAKDRTNPDSVEVYAGDVHGKAISRAQGELDSAKDELKAIHDANGFEDDAKIKVEEKASSYDKVVQAARDEQRAAQETSDIMTATAKGQTEVAKEARIRTEYEERIAKALHDGKDDLAAQLKIQQDLDTSEAKLADFLKSPAQRAKEARDATRKGQDMNRMQTGGGTIDSQGPNSLIPHAADLIPDNANLPDNADLPDNVGPATLPGRPGFVTPLPNIMAGARKLGRDGIPGFSADNPFDMAAPPFDIHMGMPAPDAPDGNQSGFGGMTAADIHGPIVDALQSHGNLMHDLMTA